MFEARHIVKYLVLASVLVLFIPHVMAQPENKYARITAVYNLDETDIDSVEVDDPSEFDVADTVMYIQMKGTEYYDPINTPIELYPWGRTPFDINNTGRYCILLINKIVGNIIVFTTTLRDDIQPQETGELAQLVKVLGGKKVWNINQDMTCDPWDPVARKGGVFVMFASRKIVLNANIDVTGKGFRGGDPDVPVTDYYKGDCNATDARYFTEVYMDSAGRKGESIVYDDFPLTRGRGRMGIGGGGGNGKYSGGGGGANFGGGGSGGLQVESCSFIPPAEGGYPHNNFYHNSGEDKNRILMGGGGGTGTQNPDSGRLATPGGNGGGLVILITDTLQAAGASRYIRANGGSVADTATAGAGGGGGAGVIVVDAYNYLGAIRFEAKGGDGGWTNHTEPTGPGGPGGGGVIWHSGTSFEGNVQTSVQEGQPGQHVVDGFRGTTTGGLGAVRSDLVIPLRGLLFNVMPPDQDICENTKADPFIASIPKGGYIDSFRFEWQTSPDQFIWSPAPGKNDSIYYDPGLLTDTIHFRRIVQLINLDDTIADTSSILTINVLPKIEGNQIISPDTICKYNITDVLRNPDGTEITGSNFIPNGGYFGWIFNWQKSVDSINWEEEDYGIPLAPRILDTTTYFRRVIEAYVCYDTSNTIEIKVLEPIAGNIIVPDDSICKDEVAVPLVTEDIVSGAMGPGSYSYSWYTSENGIDFTITDSILDSYAPGFQGEVDTLYFQRWVVSGPDSACIDTSNIAQIIIHGHITQNNIASDDTICADDKTLRLNQLSGSPGGGNLSEYLYRWEMRDQEGSWITANGNTDSIFYEPGYLTDTTYFRRWITSGACTEVSNEIEVILQDSILNNLIAGRDTICYGVIPGQILDQPPDVTGGDRQNYAYWWEGRTDETTWSVISGETAKDFSPPALFDTTWYRRVVSSGRCIHYSDSVGIIVQDLISNNLITNGSQDETCYDSVLLLTGTNALTGGDRSSYEFLWEKSTDDMNWTTVDGDSTAVNHTTATLFAPMYYRRVSFSGECIDTTSSTHVLINPRPSGSLFTEVRNPACYNSNGDPIEVTVPVSFDVGTYPFTIIYTDGINLNDTAVINSGGMDQFIHSLTTPDSTVFQIEMVKLIDGKGCNAYPDSIPGMVEKSLYRLPVTVIDNDPDTVELCSDHHTIVALPDIGKGHWEQASGDNRLVIESPSQDQTRISTTFNPQDSQYYKLYWVEQNWPLPGTVCMSKDSVEVIFYEEPEPAHAGGMDEFAEYDSVLYFASYLHLFADEPTAGTGRWTVLDGPAIVQDDTVYNSYVDLGDQNLDEDVEFLFKWEITNGVCPVTQDELYMIRKDIKIYEGFSPDGNNINDYFIIEGLDYADTYDLKIYTRTGIVIYQASKGLGEEGISQQLMWDGNYPGGRPVENGIYYYTLEVTKGQATYLYKNYIIVTRKKI